MKYFYFNIHILSTIVYYYVNLYDVIKYLYYPVIEYLVKQICYTLLLHKYLTCNQIECIYLSMLSSV